MATDATDPLAIDRGGAGTTIVAGYVGVVAVDEDGSRLTLETVPGRPSRHRQG